VDKNLERHLECSGCKKPISICYTEVVGGEAYRLGMCKDCPLLKKKLYGSSGKEPSQHKEMISTVSSCGGCGTQAEDIKRGGLVGCGMCYDVFEELLVDQLLTSKRLHKQVIGLRQKEALHMGRLPGKLEEVSPATELLALHKALHETLSREDYEQAAWLRDQIKELTEKEGRNE